MQIKYFLFLIRYFFCRLESRSNSVGAVFPRRDPEAVFGSLICVSEQLDSTLSEIFDASSGNDFTFRTSTSQKDKYASEVSLTSQSSLNIKGDSLSSEKSKENEKQEEESKNVPKSISADTFLTQKYAATSRQPKIQYQQQCCSGFGTGNRRFQSDACLIM